MPESAEFVDDTAYLSITGGAHEISDVDFTTGYEFFNSTRKYQADVFFDATANASVPGLVRDIERLTRSILGILFLLRMSVLQMLLSLLFLYETVGCLITGAGSRC